MKITSITIGKSVQVFNGVGLPEHWNKVSVSAEIDGNVEDEQKVIDDLFAIVNSAHNKHSASSVEDESYPPQRRFTITDLKRESNATPK